MRPRLWVFGITLVAASLATATDVPMRDGTVIAADSYKVTGSYVMINLPDGSQVAFDVADVDLAALREAEAAAAAAAGTQAAAQPEQQPNDTISSGRSLKHPGAADDTSEGLTISDRDVKHMRGSGVRGEDEQQEADSSGVETPAEGDYQVGGSVVLNNVRVNPAGEGRWQIQGDVVNRSPRPVLNVTVKLETLGGSEPWSGEVRVAASLGPDEKASFEHSFMAEVPEGKAQPSVRASVLWMQEESRREPDYTKAGGVPHPSNLPLQFGGVSGADVRPTPIQ
jgi:hypothetical protein